MDAEEQLPDCCGRPTRFVRSVSNFGALSPLRKFQCNACGVRHMVRAELKVAAVRKSVEQAKLPALSKFEMIRKIAYTRFADMRSVDSKSFNRLRTRAV